MSKNTGKNEFRILVTLAFLIFTATMVLAYHAESTFMSADEYAFSIAYNSLTWEEQSVVDSFLTQYFALSSEPSGLYTLTGIGMFATEGILIVMLYMVWKKS